MDGDGYRNEVVAASPDAVSWSRVIRDGRFFALERTSVQASGAPSVLDVLVGYVAGADTDLREDIVVVSSASVVLYHGSDTTTTTLVGTSTSNGFVAACLCNTDGADVVDVLVLERTAATTARVLRYRPTAGGTYTASPLLASVPLSSALSCALYDGDALPDVLVGSDSGVTMYRNRNLGASFEAGVRVVSTPASRMVVLDADDDGAVDVFAASANSSVMFFHERATATSLVAHRIGLPAIGAFTLHDTDLNGVLDVVVGDVVPGGFVNRVLNSCRDSSVCFPAVQLADPVSTDGGDTFRTTVGDFGACVRLRRQH
jgi:hypothetical protein